ncbi:GNAT family N-acetyltransferase [Chitinimonas naiadis]
MASCPFRLEPLSAAQAPLLADELATLFMASRATAMPWLPVLHGHADTAQFFAGLALSHEVWLARDEHGALLGFVAYDLDWLDHLYLAPAARQAGIGSALLRHAMRDGRPRQLWCFAANLPARRFYEKHGFVVEVETDGADNEERCPDVRYVHPGLAG